MPCIAALPALYGASSGSMIIHAIEPKLIIDPRPALRIAGSVPGGCIAAGAVTTLSVIGFIRREISIAQPIINLRFFRDRDFALVTAAHAALNLAGFSIMLLVPFYLDRLGGLSILF